jgi:heme/copper-type cytochrome/quinol oxidase subunit 4
MNEDKNKKTAMIRAILCVIVIVIVILGWIDIIPKTAGIVAASLILCVISVWNGLVAIKNQQKHVAVFNFIITGVIVILCAGVIVL